MTSKRFSIELVCFAIVVTVAALLVPSHAHAQDAATLYAQRCAACHGAGGKGDGPAGQYLHPKPTDFATSLKGKGDDWTTKAIKGGGAAVGLAPVMPAYPDLSDDQIKGLVDYVKHLGS